MNEVILGDNLDVMRTMGDNFIDLIYVDPPFNTGRSFGEFSDKWDSKPNTTDRLYWMIDSLHSTGMANYVSYMQDRLVETARILKPNGSIYLHCDPRASHYLKLIMDQMFGSNAFREEIVWKRYGRKSCVTRRFGRVTDTILFYALRRYAFNPIFTPTVDINRKFPYKDADGRRYNTNHPLDMDRGLTASNNLYTFKGYTPKLGWRLPLAEVSRLEKENRIHWTKGGKPRKKIYADESKGTIVNSLWDDIPFVFPHSSEATGYPTQKPLKLLRRIVKASSNPGDIVFDPFCGSGTSLVAAQQLERQYIGIDCNSTAVDIAKQRLDGLYE